MPANMLGMTNTDLAPRQATGWRITETEYAATVAKLEKINQRAAKRGLAGRLTLDATPVTITDTDDAGFERTYRMYDVRLGGEAPRYNGWAFIATLDWDQHAGLVVRTAPGIVSVDREQLVDGACDHCHKNRHRRNTYLLRHDDGRQVQVGSSCIKDFLGWAGSIVWLDPDDIGRNAFGLDEFGFGAGSPDAYGTDYVLALAWAVIKLQGWRSAGSFEGPTTKGTVLDILCPPRSPSTEQLEFLARMRTLAREAAERAAEIRAWVLSDEFTGGSEYVINLKAIAAADMVSIRNVGVLVSAPQAWSKYLGQTLMRSRDELSEWVGSPKERITVTATISSVRFIPGDWGTTVLYVLRDVKGNVYKWFASREVLGDKPGETVTVKATVKEHGEYKGVKETVLTRAKPV